MLIDDLVDLEPTIDGPKALDLIQSFVLLPWRCYSSKIYEDTPNLAEEYINKHALVPGVATEVMQSKLPGHIFYYHDPITNSKSKGGLWSNGAILYVVNPGNKPIINLFVDEDTAAKWFYPDEGWINLEKIAKEKQKNVND